MAYKVGPQAKSHACTTVLLACKQHDLLPISTGSADLKWPVVQFFSYAQLDSEAKTFRPYHKPWKNIMIEL